jgi:NDP-4-keto-2,6-dideoxyhexose 3-C-methyltransferase
MHTQACRACGTAPLVNRLDLGTLRVSDFPAADQDLASLPAAPLALAECPRCTLVQLTDTYPRRALFAGDYWYASGINGTMREDLRQVVRRARQFVAVRDGDVVLDIGANDGTLLRAWLDHAWEGRPRRLAVEPAETFRTPLADAADQVIPDLFPEGAETLLTEYRGQVRVVTAVAMFYSVDQPRAFAQAVRELLTDDGLWVIQFQDLQQMLEAGAVDNICHEHLTYPSLTALLPLLHTAGFYVQHVERTPINGGSLRVFARPVGSGQGVTPSVYATVTGELDLQDRSWPRFLQRYQQAIHDLRETLTVATGEPHRHIVDLLGASTKGNTLLQLAGVGPATLDQPWGVRWAWERHLGKVGRRTITGVPIVHEGQGREWPPHLLICPIWQFRDAVIEREQAYLAAGGRIYFPLPVGEVVMQASAEDAR